LLRKVEQMQHFNFLSQLA